MHFRLDTPDARGIAEKMVSGWTLNSIVTLQSGFPFTPQLSYNPSNNGDTRNPVRPFVNPSFHRPGDSWKVRMDGLTPRLFLPLRQVVAFMAMWGATPSLAPGLALGTFRSPKSTKLAERSLLQFRAELFNVLNRANFNSPNAIVFTPSGFRRQPAWLPAPRLIHARSNLV